MTVELVCVGTEILMGNIVNTNAAYMSEKCAMLGLSMWGIIRAACGSFWYRQRAALTW